MLANFFGILCDACIKAGGLLHWDGISMIFFGEYPFPDPEE